MALVTLLFFIKIVFQVFIYPLYHIHNLKRSNWRQPCHRCTHGSPPPPFSVLLQDANFANTSAALSAVCIDATSCPHWLRPYINHSNLRSIMPNYGAATQEFSGYKGCSDTSCFLYYSPIAHLLSMSCPAQTMPLSMVILPWMSPCNVIMLTIL